MTDPISTAFDRLDARAGQGETGTQLDRISLRDHVVKVEIGAFQVERGTTQRVAFDVVVEVAPPSGPLADDVDQILSYEMLVQAIAAELAAERLNLLETLAERIAERILHAPQALRVFLRIQKLDLGPGALGVEIVRRKGGEPSDADAVADPALPPVLAYLSNAAFSSPALASWLDQMQAHDNPVIIFVGPGDIPAPHSIATPAQRRIDLLAIEQNAWVLAGLDRRCLVVNTRAEFEWAARKHRLSVWAPSKIVLDAVHGPETVEIGDLVHWFASEFSAAEILCIGADLPGTGRHIRLDQNDLGLGTGAKSGAEIGAGHAP